MILASSENLSMGLSLSAIEGFKAKVEVSICFIEHRGKILLLKNSNKNIENNKWGVPGGKLNVNESPLQAVIREVFEETGMHLKLSHSNLVHTIYIRTLGTDSILHVFQIELSNVIKNHKITLDSNEHNEYIWESPIECLQLDLIKGEAEIIRLLYNYSTPPFSKE